MSIETQAADDMLHITTSIFRLTVDGMVVTLRLAGHAAQYLGVHLAARCKAASMKDSGEVQLRSLIKHGAPLNVVALSREDAERFQALAKETGLLFHLKHDQVDYDGNYRIDGLSTIIFRQQDTQLVNSMLERIQANSLAQASMEMTPAPPEAQQMQQPATDWAQQIPVGRIDLLASSGEILDSEEYMNEDAFLSAVQENSRNDTPMGIVLYRNADGNTISGDFLRDLNKMPESFRTEDYVQKSDWSEQIPVGRIDYLSNSGGIQQRVEYTNEADFLRDIQENSTYGVPLEVVLYRNADGETISSDVLTSMNPPPQGFHIETYVKDVSQQLTVNSKEVILERSTGEQLEGTWSVVGTTQHVGKTLFVLESDNYGYTEKIGHILADADRHIYAENIHDISLADAAPERTVPENSMSASKAIVNRIDFYTVYFYNEQGEEAVSVLEQSPNQNSLAAMAAEHGFTGTTEASVTRYYYETSENETQLSPQRKADILETVQSDRSLDNATILGRRHYTVMAKAAPQRDIMDMSQLDNALSQSLSEKNMAFHPEREAAR